MVLLRGRENREELIVRIFFPIGILSICCSLLLSRVFFEMPFFAFIEGLLLGIAMVFLVTSAYYFGKKRKKDAGARSNDSPLKE